MPEQTDQISSAEVENTDAVLLREFQKAVSEASCHCIHVANVQSGVVTASLHGKIVLDPIIHSLGSVLFRIAENAKVKGLVLDCANVSKLSSAAFGKLITTNQLLKVRRKPGLTLSNLPPELAENFVITKLYYGTFDIHYDPAPVVATIEQQREQTAAGIRGNAEEQ